MDGWGAPARKINTYKQFVYAETTAVYGVQIVLQERPERAAAQDVDTKGTAGIEACSNVHPIPVR